MIAFTKRCIFIIGCLLITVVAFAEHCCTPILSCTNTCTEECNTPCYDPCARFDYRIQVGIQPIVWRNRGGIIGELQSGRDSALTYKQAQCIPKFSTFYNIPWVVGGQIGYTWKDCLRIFLETNYAQARARNACKTKLCTLESSGAPAGSTSNFRINTYRFSDAYLGAQYYIGYLCNLRLFLGAKIGFIHHRTSNFGFSQTVANEPPVTTEIISPCSDTPFIKKSAAFAGGVSFGFEYHACNNWFLGISTEVVVNEGPKTNCYIPTNIQKNSLKALMLGPIKREIRFPIVATLRHSF